MKKWLVFCLLTVALSSCEKLETVPMSPTTYWPLDSGNSWTYADTVFLWIDSLYQLPRTSFINWQVTRTGYFDVEEEGELQRFESVELAMEQQGRFFFVRLRPETGQVRRMPRTPFLSHFPEDELFESYDFPSWTSSPTIEFPLDSGDQFTFVPIGWLDQTPVRINEAPWAATFPPGGLTVDFDRYLLIPNSPQTVSVGSTARVVTTEAGSFQCLDLGGYFWSENVGFVGASFENQWKYWDAEAEDSVHVRLLRKRELVRVDFP